MNNTADIRQGNIAAVLRSLYQRGEGTKNAIAAELNLSNVTVHNLINELCDKAIVEESGGFVSSGGRRALLYRINEKYGYAIGVNIMRRSLRVTIYNIGLKCVYEKITPWDLGNINECLNILNAEVQSALDESVGKKIIGIGITIPGRSSFSGDILDIPDYPEYNGILLDEYILAGEDIPITVDNDTVACALSSKWLGLAENYRNYIYFSIDEGAGAGVILDGNVFYGSNRHGCEIGHTTVEIDGRLCRCGKKGCLQAYVGSNLIIERIMKIHPEASDFEKAGEYYRNGDTDVIGILDEAVRFASLAIENLIRVYDPEGIILQSRMFTEIPELINKLNTKAQISVMHTPKGYDLYRTDKKCCKLIINRTDAVSSAAAACLVLNRFYNRNE